MAWNIAIMFVKADKSRIKDIIPDVFDKTYENLCFEDAVSVSMNKALGVSTFDDWVIITDVEGRFIFDELYPKETSKKFRVKIFWISEGMVFREYWNGQKINEIRGIKRGKEYLNKKGKNTSEEYGEFIIQEIMDEEILLNKEQKVFDILFDLKFDKYGLPFVLQPKQPSKSILSKIFKIFKNWS